MNNGKYFTESYIRKQQEKIDRLWGPVKQHTKECECCGKEFVVEGREKTKKLLKASRFCSRSCANNRSSWWKDNHTGYRTIAFHHYGKKCAICGFDKVVEVHHIDRNRDNNDVSNLIPLCPNHHVMLHRSKYGDEVKQQINELMGV